MIMNYLNGVWLDIYILKIIFQSELEKSTKILPESLILKTKFTVKVRDIHKIEKKNSISISVFGYENNKKYPIYV